MKRNPFLASEDIGFGCVLVILIMAAAGPMPAVAAERAVLCEEFTNKW